VTQTYRIRYSQAPNGKSRSPTDVQSVDLEASLDQIPGLLPPAVYIMYIEDLTTARNVHWTRWPKSFRPGFGG
jgi:hypothetical protein